MSSWVSNVLWVLSTVLVVAVATPRFLVAVPVIVSFYTYVQNFYVPASRELKRLDSVARSPIYSHFSETLMGSSTVRAYGQSERFMQVRKKKKKRKEKKNHHAMQRALLYSLYPP
jgi:ATP-binding cassette subfamily C (CFTR/MRP) protein 1